MNNYQWSWLTHVSIDDNWGDPSKMDYSVILGIEQLSEYTGKKVVIHCGYEKRSSGFHPQGLAVDLHIEGMSLFDQFVVASRFLRFTGIGVYPWWNNPGLHVDCRPVGYRRSYWASTAKGVYVAITEDIFK